MSARATNTTVLMLSLVTATAPAGAQHPSAQARCTALSTLQVPGAELSDVKLLRENGDASDGLVREVEAGLLLLHERRIEHVALG